MDDIPQFQIKTVLQQLQLSPPPKLFRKAMQYLRKLHLQMQNMTNMHPAAPAVCLHFAYIRKRKDFSREDMLQKIGLKDSEYTALFQSLKARLKLDLTLPITHLAVKYKCSSIKLMAKSNYDTFKSRFESKLAKDQLKFVKWGDEYPIAALFLTAQRQKMKLDLSTILKDCNVSKTSFDEAKDEIIKTCSDIFGATVTITLPNKTSVKSVGGDSNHSNTNASTTTTDMMQSKADDCASTNETIIDEIDNMEVQLPSKSQRDKRQNQLQTKTTNHLTKSSQESTINKATIENAPPAIDLKQQREILREKIKNQQKKEKENAIKQKGIAKPQKMSKLKQYTMHNFGLIQNKKKTMSSLELDE